MSSTLRHIKGLLWGFVKDLKFLLKALRAFLAVALIVFTAMVGFVFWNQEKLIFPATKKMSPPPRMSSLSFEEKKLENPFGENGEYHSWFYKKENCPRVIFFFGGNGQNMGEITERILWMEQNFDSSFFFADYPGFGKNSGKPGEVSIQRLMNAWGEVVKNDLGYTSENIFVWGYSLGGAVALQHLEKFPAKALVLESTFTSMYDMAHYRYPLLPISLLLRHHFKSSEIIPQVKIPTLVMHSPIDHVIPYSQGKQLYGLCSSPLKIFVELKGSHHESYASSREEVLSAIKKIAPEYLK